MQSFLLLFWFENKAYQIISCYIFESILSFENKNIWRRMWQPTEVLLPGISHGQRSLVGYSPWGRKELTQLSKYPVIFKGRKESQES